MLNRVEKEIVRDLRSAAQDALVVVEALINQHAGPTTLLVTAQTLRNAIARAKVIEAGK
jgi:hypothetical protein